MRKTYKCNRGNNLKMNDEVYKLRKIVMNHIYEAKNLLRKYNLNMERVTIRIIELNRHSEEKGVLGVAKFNDNIIWVPKKTLVTKNELYIRQVVFHELLHANYGIEHKNNCSLMGTTLKNVLSVEEQNRKFLSYITLDNL